MDPQNVTLNEKSQFLSLCQLATLLRVSQEFVRLEVRRGSLRAVRLGPRGMHRFRPADVVAYLNERSRTADDAQR